MCTHLVYACACMAAFLNGIESKMECLVDDIVKIVSNVLKDMKDVIVKDNLGLRQRMDKPLQRAMQKQEELAGSWVRQAVQVRT